MPQKKDHRLRLMQLKMLIVMQASKISLGNKRIKLEIAKNTLVAEEMLQTEKGLNRNYINHDKIT